MEEDGALALATRPVLWTGSPSGEAAHENELRLAVPSCHGMT